MSSTSKDSLFSLVQAHERNWGNESYTGRPSLEAILRAPIVVFWYTEGGKGERYTVTLHDKREDLYKLLARQLLFGSNEKRRLVSVFELGKRLKPISVTVEFVEDAE